jgi:hypothetical protein
MCIRTVATICLFSFVGPIHAAEPPSFLDSVATYQLLGGEYGGFYLDDFGLLKFLKGAQAAAKGVPGFSISQFSTKRPKFPQVQVPFGLKLSSKNSMRACLHKLDRLKNLTTLDMAGTELTDADLIELTDLKSLSTLSLNRTQK